MRQNLYCIVIIPPEPVYSETREFQQHIADKYNSHAALKPPPHITLIPPFALEEDKEQILFKYVDAIASNENNFEIAIDGFGSFTVGVIYEAVILSDPLKKLEKELSLSFYKKFKAKRGPSHAYVPHVTIAFKDLSPLKFPAAWDEFKEKLYRRKWTVSSLCILRANPKGGWDIIRQSKFGMQKDGDTMALF